jgi:hypothetical protein
MYQSIWSAITYKNSALCTHSYCYIYLFLAQVLLLVHTPCLSENLGVNHINFRLIENITFKLQMVCTLTSTMKEDSASKSQVIKL